MLQNDTHRSILVRRNGERIVSVQPLKQAKDEWCWAACARMILNGPGTGAPSQCLIAGRAFEPHRDCCNGAGSTCSMPRSDAQISQLLTDLQIENHYTANAVPFSDLQSENDLDRPVEVGYSFGNGLGHVVLVRGYALDARDPFLLVNDPGSGAFGKIRYSRLLAARGLGGRWDGTWTGLRRI